MTYCVFDLETTVKESYKRKANPLDKRNKIIVAAYRSSADRFPATLYNPKGLDRNIFSYEGEWHKIRLCDKEILVGQNIKFDLLYVWDDPDLQEWIKKGGRVFDTMVAEYLLTAQQSTYTSLNDLALKYGGTIKDDRIKELWEEGFDTDQIDPEILLPYAENDVLNTETIFLRQLDELKKQGLLPLFWGYMDHYLALIEMEYNGLYVDRQKLADLEAEETAKLQELSAKLMTEVADAWPIDTPFNPDSVEHVSAVLFGTSLTVEVDVPTLDIEGNKQYFGPNAKKAGELKTHKETIEVQPKTFRYKSGKVAALKRKKLVYSSDVKVLHSLPKDPFIEKLLEYREHKKLLSTYIYGQRGKTETGLRPLIYKTDSCIHHTLDCVLTPTGRVNSRNPNGQNLPKAIKPVFTSRFGKEGRIVEFDYNQLEVVVQAYLSQSSTMIQHIKDGVDFHCKRLAYAEELSYEQVIENLKADPGVWGAKRRAAKTVSFQKAYGAHAEKIAEETGLSVETVEKIFRAEDEEYPEIGNFNYDVMTEVQQTRVPNGQSLLQIRDKDRGTYDTRPSEAEGIGYWRSVTGKRYHFIEKGVTSAKLRECGRDPFRYFKEPEIANYPVQGTATDIVVLSVGRAYRFIIQNDLRDVIKLINEVHDSLMNDADYSSPGVKERVQDILNILNDVPGTLHHYLGLDFNVPIGVDCKIGNYWGANDE